MDQKPSVGRIVHFKLPDGPNKGQVRPAIIVRTWGNDYCVQLQVFLDKVNDGDAKDFASSAMHDSQIADPLQDAGCWFWPPRV